MTSLAQSTFVYVTYIRTTPDRLWEALTKPEFTKQYWAGAYHDTDWKPGSSWHLVFEDGDVADTGEIVECDPPNRLVFTWQNQSNPNFKNEGPTLCTIELEPMGPIVKLTVTHTMDRAGSKAIDAFSNGWPRVLSSLKSLLETGSTIAFRQG